MSEKTGFEDFEKWADERSNKLLRVDHFNSMGKGEDYVFQALVFAGEASQGLSLATTVIRDYKVVPENLKMELKNIQQQLHDFKDKLRGL